MCVENVYNLYMYQKKKINTQPFLYLYDRGVFQYSRKFNKLNIFNFKVIYYEIILSFGWKSYKAIKITIINKLMHNIIINSVSFRKAYYSIVLTNDSIILRFIHDLNNFKTTLQYFLLYTFFHSVFLILISFIRMNITL